MELASRTINTDIGKTHKLIFSTVLPILVNSPSSLPGAQATGSSQTLLSPTFHLPTNPVSSIIKRKQNRLPSPDGCDSLCPPASSFVLLDFSHHSRGIQKRQVDHSHSVVPSPGAPACDFPSLILLCNLLGVLEGIMHCISPAQEDLSPHTCESPLPLTFSESAQNTAFLSEDSSSTSPSAHPICSTPRVPASCHFALCLSTRHTLPLSSSHDVSFKEAMLFAVSLHGFFGVWFRTETQGQDLKFTLAHGPVFPKFYKQTTKPPKISGSKGKNQSRSHLSGQQARFC